jgi:succinoglycan biosynthesis protein ExoU
MQPETAEVLVMDDLSSDRTADAARSADDGSGRLKVLTLEQNGGPSAARNKAIEIATGEYIAILDADDHLMPGRFTAMFTQGSWDIIADDIYFTSDLENNPEHSGPVRARDLDLVAFIEGNMPQGNTKRGELGFLKPIIRRDVLAQGGHRYPENMKLGEDFALYTQLLLKGARFKLISNCGYKALVRANSLSGRHSAHDLMQLYLYDVSLSRDLRLKPSEKIVLARHCRFLKGKARHREFLDMKREQGLLKAVVSQARDPDGLLLSAKGIFLDKWNAWTLSSKPVEANGRYLLRDWF